jgi:hypothetical protein
MGLFRKDKNIYFEPINEYIESAALPPIPASSSMPSWYKELPRYVNNSDKPIKALGHKDLKTCVPFRDAMVSGYLMLLSADVEVAIAANGDVDIFTNRQLIYKVVEKRGNINDRNSQGFGMPHPAGTVPIMFAWSPSYGIKTNNPDSVLITHPLNRHDLPFVTTSGLIDSDYFGLAGNMPFFIKEGFSGVIPKGTPIAQIIPFERKKWVSEKLVSDEKAYSLFMTLRDSYLYGFYSRFMRQPKEYK